MLKMEKYLKAGTRLLINPDYRFLFMADKMGRYNRMPDEQYLRKRFKATIGRDLNLENPQTYNEKIQWLKLYDRKPLYTELVDKIEVKKYVADKIGDEYVIPLLGVWNSPEEIDFTLLPNQFVLKCNHNSGLGMYICKDKSKLDIDRVKRGLNIGLKEDKYLLGREWPYKNVKRRILAEKYMEDNTTHDLKDYKFFAFDGVVKALFIATERQSVNEETKFDFFDAEFQHLGLINGHPNAEITPSCPKAFEEMKRLAEKLSKGFPHVRVDFYEVNGKVYFGEFTFSHWSGLMPFEPESWDYTFGSWITLPKSSK